MTTCTSAKIQWDYGGHANSIALLISSASVLSDSQPTSATKRAIVSLPIAYGLDPSQHVWTWPTVNVTSGWYILEAIGPGIASMSSKFFIGNSTDTQCLANSLSPLAHIPPSQSSTSDHNTPSVSRSSITPVTTSTALGTGPGNSAVLVGSIFGGVIVFAAAVYAAYRFMIPRLLSHDCSRRSSVAESSRVKGDHRSSSAPVSSLSTLPYAEATKPAGKRPDAAVTVTPKLRPLPPIPTLSQISSTLFSHPTSATVTLPDPLDTSHPSGSAATPRAATLAKLETSLAPTFAPSPHTTPLARRSGLDQSDAASSLWARRHSAASSWSVGVSGTGSPVPSSATSQMYRIRDSVWALVRSHSREEFVDSPTLPHRKAASFDGLKRNAAVTAIPDVPPLPARFRTEGRQSVG